MSDLDDLKGTIAAILSATDAIRKPTERGRRVGIEAIRKAALEEGLPELDAARISVRLTTASWQFADACVTANRKARALADALAELETMAGELAEESTERGPE